MKPVHDDAVVAVVGAGVSGAVCAASLRDAGRRVVVFDKSRGPGGRLATRRVEWTDRDGRERTTRFDHGAPGFEADGAAMHAWIDAAERGGRLGRWQPRIAGGGRLEATGGWQFVPTPDSPSLCRHWLAGIATRWQQRVVSLRRSGERWHLVDESGASHGPFAAVVLAMPPQQAADLMVEWRPDWARAASVVWMHPCWTLMGVTAAPPMPPLWDVALPEHGPLARIIRNDTRPGRESRPGELHWVVHARSSWSRANLERDAAEVERAMADALGDALGAAPDWRLRLVHRWRYASVAATPTTSWPGCWWDPSLGLGVCGDFLGGIGVAGAWHSGHQLARRLGAGAPPFDHRATEPAADSSAPA